MRGVVMHRTYTEKLEKVINVGIDLRHKMRIKNETQASVIDAQRSRIIDLQNEVERLNYELSKKPKESNKDAQIAALKRKLERMRAADERDNVFKRKLIAWVKERNAGAIPPEILEDGK